MIRRVAAAAACAGALLLGGAPAYADATPAPPVECSDPGFTCDYEGTQWNVSTPGPASDNGYPYSDPTDNGPSPGGMFALFAIFALVVGGGGLWWRVSAARRIATQAGLDPETAVTATLLSHDGLAATYLAANLRPQPQPYDEPPVRHVEPPVRSTEDRLGELKRLHDQGLITDADYDRRRRVIVDTV